MTSPSPMGKRIGRLLIHPVGLTLFGLGASAVVEGREGGFFYVISWGLTFATTAFLLATRGRRRRFAAWLHSFDRLEGSRRFSAFSAVLAMGVVALLRGVDGPLSTVTLGIFIGPLALVIHFSAAENW